MSSTFFPFKIYSSIFFPFSNFTTKMSNCNIFSNSTFFPWPQKKEKMSIRHFCYSTFFPITSILYTQSKFVSMMWGGGRRGQFNLGIYCVCVETWYRWCFPLELILESELSAICKRDHSSYFDPSILHLEIYLKQCCT